MLEETRLDYALVTVFVEVWISIGSCRRLLLDDEQPFHNPIREGLPTIPELLPLPKSRFLVHNVEIDIRLATVRLERLGKQICPRSAESFVVVRAPAILQIKHIKSRKSDI